MIYTNERNLVSVHSHSTCVKCPESVVVDKTRLFGINSLLQSTLSLVACSGDEGCTAATSYQAGAIPLGQDQNIQMPLKNVILSKRFGAKPIYSLAYYN